MNWNNGFSATYYATFVDPSTWRDIERFEIISGSVTRGKTGLRDSADVTCRTYDPERERWIRIYLDAKQADSGAHEAIFTGLATSPEVKLNGNVKEYPLQCYSVLKPADDIILPRGWYAPAGAEGGRVVAQLLSVCPCPVEVSSESPTLSQSVIAEENDTNLTMADKILSAINWRLRMHGDGTVEIAPQAVEPSATFDVLDNDSIEPELSFAHNWFDCPNCFRAIRDDVSAEARDDDPASPLSTVSRGREVWEQETSSDLSNNESIGEYAIRRLKELQSSYIKISYSRRFFPDLLVGDTVRLHYPGQGIDGVFDISNQSVEMSHGARTQEEVTYGQSSEDIE